MAVAEIKWRKVAAYGPLISRFDHSLSQIRSSLELKIYAFGGHGSIDSSNYFQVIDQNLNEWKVIDSSMDEEITSDSLVRGSHASATVGDSIFVFGGFSNKKSLNDVLEYDTKISKWNALKFDHDHFSPRSSHSSTTIGNKIYIIGGYGEKSSLMDVHIFDVENKKWIKPKVLGKPPPARCSHSADVIKDEKIVIFGGHGDKPLNDVWFLEVDTPYTRSQTKALGLETVLAWSRGRTAHEARTMPIVICGPSGVGKGTLINRLTNEFSSRFGFSVSHTTRAPRPGEVDGVHYHFSSKEDMQREIDEGNFLESAAVHGNLYGTSKSSVQKVIDEGKMCVLDIDVQGAEQVKKSSMDAFFIFVSPPSYEELEKRLRGRGTETEAQIEKRLKNAFKEMERSKDSSLFDLEIVNDDLNKAYDKLKNVLGLNQTDDDIIDNPPPSGRSGHASALVGSKLLIHGGIADKNTVLDDIHILETSNLSGGAPGYTDGLKWLAVKNSEPTLWSYLYSYFSSESSEDTPQPTARYNHKALTLNKAEVLVCGGYCPKQKALGDSFVLTIS